MKRIIEALIEKRKQKQSNLKKNLDELGKLLTGRGFWDRLTGRADGEIARKLSEFNERLNELVTAQDKEWDAYSNNHSSMVFKSLQWKIEKLEAEYANARALMGNFIQLEQSLKRLIASIDQKTGNPEDHSKRLKDIADRLSPYQYSDFEQRFRGGEESVKEKLKGYLPIFENCEMVLDIGCGRGEFVELLRAEGKRAEGIDISGSMLQVAVDKGLPCHKGDALEHLAAQPDDSLDGIFSAQVIEHVEPDYLRELVRQCFRTLKKNGPIVLETVNPLSLFALSNIYFLDVTHCKPLHPEYMRYLMESSGFNGVNVIYGSGLTEEQLETTAPDQPVAREFNSNVDKLNKLLYASPVYAVTGVK